MTTFSDDQALERKLQKAQRDRQRTEELLRAEAVKKLYSTIEGRAYLRWLLELTGAIGHNPYRTEPHDTAFQCGVLFVGQRLMAHMVETEPTKFTQLLKEPDNAPRTEPRDSEPDLFGDRDPDEPSGNGADEPALYS